MVQENTIHFTRKYERFYSTPLDEGMEETRPPHRGLKCLHEAAGKGKPEAPAGKASAIPGSQHTAAHPALSFPGSPGADS